MKLVARIATALALLGLAAPAFPCDEMKSTTASAPAKAKTKQAVAKADKKAGKAKADVKKVN